MDRIEIAKLLDSSRRQLRDEVVDLTLKQPFWQQQSGSEITDRLILDVESSLVALSKSVYYGSPMLFADHIRWQRDLFQVMGCSTGRVREICTYIWNASSARLPDDAQPAISVSIQSAMDGLSYGGVAQSFEALHVDLAEALVAATIDAHWHWQMVYGSDGRDQMLYEAWFLIDYVIDALGSGKLQGMRQQLIRVRQDLTSRGLSTFHVRQLVWFLNQAAEARMQAGDVAELQHMMGLALHAIDDTAESSVALLGAQEHIVAEVARQLTTAGLSPHTDQTPIEIGWYLAYLADSIAAGSPEPMCGYTRWMQHWLANQGLPDTPLRHSYEALYTAVGHYLPEYAAREAMSVLQVAQRLL